MYLINFAMVVLNNDITDVLEKVAAELVVKYSSAVIAQLN